MNPVIIWSVVSAVADEQEAIPVMQQQQVRNVALLLLN